MKKSYETPALVLLHLQTADLLSSSSDAVGIDEYDSESAPYGEKFA